MDQVIEVLRYHHYALRTEKTYLNWIAKFIRFHGRRHPRDLGKQHIEAFLSDMAVNKNYARSTQDIALNSIVFLYKQVLDLPVSNQLVLVTFAQDVFGFEVQHAQGGRVDEGAMAFPVRAEDAFGTRFQDEARALLGALPLFTLQCESQCVCHGFGGLLLVIGVHPRTLVSDIGGSKG